MIIKTLWRELWLNKQAKRHAILNALRDGQRKTALQIGDATNLLPGTIYPILYYYERHGAIKSTWAPETYPHQRVYWIDPR